MPIERKQTRTVSITVAQTMEVEVEAGTSGGLLRDVLLDAIREDRANPTGERYLLTIDGRPA